MRCAWPPVFGEVMNRDWRTIRTGTASRTCRTFRARDAGLLTSSRGANMHAEGKGNISRIVVGLDDSEGSRAAARWCADHAGATGARVTAVHGLGKLPGVLIGGPDAVATGLGLSGSRFHSWRAELRSHLERWCVPLLAAAVDYRTELVDDDVVDALLQMAEKEHADLIVVGAQGHGGMVSRLLGGVPYMLAHHSHVPMVIVLSATRAAGEDALGERKDELGGIDPLTTTSAKPE